MPMLSSARPLSRASLDRNPKCGAASWSAGGMHIKPITGKSSARACGDQRCRLARHHTGLLLLLRRYSPAQIDLRALAAFVARRGKAFGQPHADPGSGCNRTAPWHLSLCWSAAGRSDAAPDRDNPASGSGICLALPAPDFPRTGAGRHPAPRARRLPSTVLLTATSLVAGAGLKAAFRAASMRARMVSRFSGMLMSDALSRAKLARASRNAKRQNAGQLILMTDDLALPDPLDAARALPPGSLVIVRARDARRRAQLALALRSIAWARGLILLIADDPALARSLGANGIHLPQVRAAEAAHWRAIHPGWLITAAAHSLGAVLQAPRMLTRFCCHRSSPQKVTRERTAFVGGQSAPDCETPCPCPYSRWAASRRRTPSCCPALPASPRSAR